MVMGILWKVVTLSAGTCENMSFVLFQWVYGQGLETWQNNRERAHSHVSFAVVALLGLSMSTSLHPTGSALLYTIIITFVNL